MSQEVITGIEDEIKWMHAELNSRLEQETFHHPLMNRMKVLHQEVHSPDKTAYRPQSFLELVRLTERFYLLEAARQVSDLKNYGRNLNFSDHSFTRIPMNLDANIINAELDAHPQLLELLRIIELRALASSNGFCIVKADLFTQLTGKCSKTLQRQLVSLRQLGLINYMTSTSSHEKGGFFTVKIIRANRIFIKYFACGYKSRCNHLFYAKFLLPEFLLVSSQFTIRWKASKFSKRIPLELKWAYEIRCNFYPDFYESKQHQIKGTSTERKKAIGILGIEPYAIDCLDRPSMYELFHGKAPFWSTQLQEVARKHMRWRVSIFRKPFHGFGRDVILPRAISWEENKMSREHAIRHMPPTWVEASEKIIASEMAH